MDREKIEKKSNFYKKRIENKENFGELEYFLLAICYVELGDYPVAQQLFEEASSTMLGPIKAWRKASQVNWLVENWILSGNRDLLPDIGKELKAFKMQVNVSVANSPVANYAYGLFELLNPTGMDFSTPINILTKRPKWKDLVAIGKTFKAILDRDKIAFNMALEELLIVHQGKAKHGILRETAEGFMCMSAMSLAYAAYQYGLKANVKSEYYSEGYLDFLIEHTM